MRISKKVLKYLNHNNIIRSNEGYLLVTCLRYIGGILSVNFKTVILSYINNNQLISHTQPSYPKCITVSYSHLNKTKLSRRLNKSSVIIWQNAPDIKRKIDILISSLNLFWIKRNQIHCLRSRNSKSNAIARIYGLSRVWQLTIKIKPTYVIEVISEKYDRLDSRRQDEVLLHELVHIPKNFSGALVPHFKKGKRKFINILGGFINTYNNIRK